MQTIRDLQEGRPLGNVAWVQDSPVLSPACILPVTFSDKPRSGGDKEGREERAPMKKDKGPHFTKSDLSLLQLIKAGKEGIFYKARMTRGTCKGHEMFTCKIAKEGVTPKTILLYSPRSDPYPSSCILPGVTPKTILLYSPRSVTPKTIHLYFYVLIMEFVSSGTLRSFLKNNKDKLTPDPELQSLFTIASIHIALAMEPLRSKMVVHCDLALRNIMVNRFPWEVKVAEFGLARDLTRVRSYRSSRRKNPRERVPLRWYPPEYFRNNYYSFKGDVWSYGIVLWEMQMFGTLPYSNLETSESVVYYICAGYKNKDPDGCRPEILQIMRDCWTEPYTSRPSFTDIVRILENIMENDAGKMPCAKCGDEVKAKGCKSGGDHNVALGGCVVQKQAAQRLGERASKGLNLPEQGHSVERGGNMAERMETLGTLVLAAGRQEGWSSQ
ncbi:tyrosine-protein kinase Fer-like [Esox lucius]|uniref:tyrosine-protein kinase Fer-like n=1 Tax=Esox lucius TaxID=8010 RepID=UPI0010BDBFFC|nr:tyrosine-protein kinase Fer-like [Esox lucius]